MADAKVFARLSYEETVRRYADMVTRVCVMRCGNIEDAKDCFQNVFLKLYLSDITFDSQEHLKAWLLTVAIHQCQDMVRQFWKKNITLSGDSADLDLKQVNVEDEKDTEVLTQVLSLPVKYRQVLYLYYYEEYDVSGVAKILQLKESTVKSQLQRGRNLLKEKLGGKADEAAI